jgi:hypothetical protein
VFRECSSMCHQIVTSPPLPREQGVWDSGSGGAFGKICDKLAKFEDPFMAQAITTWFIGDGRFRVHAINAVGRRSARIIEIEDIDTGERFHGSARKLQRMFQSLGSSGIDEPAALPR